LITGVGPPLCATSALARPFFGKFQVTVHSVPFQYATNRKFDLSFAVLVVVESILEWDFF